jgi:hypothetical protein
MCVLVNRKYFPFMFLRAYRAAELRVNMLQNNIGMGIKILAP